MWLISAASVAGNLPIRLDPGEYIVGRAKRVAIVLPDLTLSRRHARLIRSKNSLIVEDLDSCNGTFVNGERISKQSAEIYDEIRFGGVLCKLAASPLAAADFEDVETTSTAPLPGGTTIGFDELTRAQLEVLQLVLQGLDEAAIASRLNRSVHTVHTHLKAIFRQFDVHSRAELIVKAVNPPVG
jgi:pSer/pThr/pTyr-binding forkhead associated (FHA) protein